MTALDVREGQGFILRHRELLALLLLNLLIKGFLLIETDVVSNDGPTYLNLSRHFLDGNLAWREALRGLYHFYAALVAILSLLVPGNAVDSLINAGQILSAIFSMLAVIPFYLLVEKVWSARAAFWGALAFCVAPGLNKYAVDVMRDPGYLLFFLSALYFGWLFIERQRVRFLLTALVFSGLAYLFRVEGFFLLPLLFLWAFLSSFWQRRGEKWLVQGLLLVLIVCGVVGTVVWYLHTDIGKMSRYGEISDGVSSLTKGELFEYNPELKKILDESGRQLPGAAHANDFFSIVKRHIRTIYFLGLVFLVAEVTWLPFFLLAIGGVVMALRREDANWYFLSFIVVYLALGFFYNMQQNYLEERYVYSLVVLLLAYAGYGLALLLEMVHKRWYGGVAVALTFLLVVGPTTIEAVKYRRKWQSHPYKEAGGWLAAQSDIKEARLLASERKIPFYAGKYDNYSQISFDIHQISELGVNLMEYDYIAIEGGKDYDKNIVGFDNFKLVKLVESDRYTAVIYKKNRYVP